MKLVVTTPLAVVLEAEDVAGFRAEDETGGFGILPGHADFVTVLAISVVTWRDAKGIAHHIAVRGGMLDVRDGKSITLATREAVCDDDLERLETEVLTRLRRETQEEEAAHADSQRLYLEAIRRITRILRPGRSGLPESTFRADVGELQQ
jgi:F-type H+-transporting ATPase subunit epsilon